MRISDSYWPGRIESGCRPRPAALPEDAVPPEYSGRMEDSTPLPKIGAPATQALTQAGYPSLDSLDGVSERRLAALHGVGPKALRIIAAELAERGGRLAE